MNLEKKPTQGAAPLSRFAAAFAALAVPLAHAGTYESTFDTDPFDPSLPLGERLIAFSNQAPATNPNRPGWIATGGNPTTEVPDGSGYLKLTDAVGGIRSTIVFPDFEPGFLVAGFKFGVDCRIGGGTNPPADGFSINFARAGDAVITTGEGYAGGPSEANLHEEGTLTGIGIGFDTYPSGTFGDGEADVIGISVRVDNVLIRQVTLNVANGEVDNVNSLQTGPLIEGTPAERIAALGWARCEVDLNPETGMLDVSWKGVKVIEQLDTEFRPSAGRLVFGSRTGGFNQAQHFDNLTLETTLAKLAAVTSATVDHNSFEIKVTDFPEESALDPADIDIFNVTVSDPAGSIEVGLDDITVTKDAATGVTTISYVHPTPFPPNARVDYLLIGEDNGGEEIYGDGVLRTPILPEQFFITEEPTLNLWNIREIRATAENPIGATPGPNIINSALVFAATPPGTPVNYTAPFLNFSDDLDGSFGDRGFFKRDALFRTNTVGVDDNNMVGLGTTRISVAEAGDYTFWVRSDDGFALRVNGGEFHKLGGTLADINAGFSVIDPSDPSTIAFLQGTGNSNTRGTITLAAGEHDLDFLWFEGTGGAYAEVSWAKGDHADDPSNGVWTLVGGSGETPYFPAAPLAEPALVSGSWAVRNYYGGGDVPTLRAAFERIANPGASTVVTATTPVVNFTDPQNPGADGLFNNNIPFPMESEVPGVDDNQFITVARTELLNLQPGDYTFALTSDDGFALRLLGGNAHLIDGSGPTNRSTVEPEFYATSGFDSLDSRTFLNTQANGTASLGAYRVVEAGNYIVEVVQVEQSGGASLEVAWAPGRHTSRNATSAWELVGNPDDPSLPALVPVMPVDVFAEVPRASEGAWSIGFYYPNPAATVNSLANAFALTSNPAADVTFGSTSSLNHLNRSAISPGTAVGGSFNATAAAPFNVPDLFFLGAGLTAEIEDMAVLATSRVVISTGGLYTFAVNSDDGFAFRIKGAPTGFIRTSGNATIDSAQTNTAYRTGGTASARSVIDLPAGEYDLEFAFYERGGAAHFELFAAPGNFTNQGDSTAWRLVGEASSGGLGLVAQPVDPGPGDSAPTIGEFTFDAATGAFSFSWNSVADAVYQIEYSTDLAEWELLQAAFVGLDGETTYSGNISDLQVGDAERVFFRLRSSE